jgi:hypothetical protein
MLLVLAGDAPTTVTALRWGTVGEQRATCTTSIRGGGEALFCEAFHVGRAIARGGEGGLGSATLSCDSEITMAATPGPQPGPGGHEQGHEHGQRPRAHIHLCRGAASV